MNILAKRLNYMFGDNLNILLNLDKNGFFRRYHSSNEANQTFIMSVYQFRLIVG